MARKDPEATKRYFRTWYAANREHVKRRTALWKKRNPLRARLRSVLNTIQARCHHPQATSYEYYGRRGIKCLLTYDDIVMLWQRDAADTMRSPTVDRYDPDDHYTVANCHIIERAENTRKNVCIERLRTRR